MDDEDVDTVLDKFFGFREKGLFVRPPGRAIDLNTFPADGNEFIYRSKLEDDLIEFPPCEQASVSTSEPLKSPVCKEKFSEKLSDNEDELEDQLDQDNIFTDLLNSVPNDNEFILWMDKSSSQFPKYRGKPSANTNESTKTSAFEENEIWVSLAAKEFSEFANALKFKREMLEERYPPKTFPSVEDEKRCCIFCLGSENFVAIYKESCNKKEAHLPLLNYVLHLSQKEVISLLKHSFKWFLAIGMNELLGKWVCALFACLKKPLSKNQVAFLEVFYDACKEHINTFEGDDLVRLHFISAVLLQYFCVKAYKLEFPGKVAK